MDFEATHQRLPGASTRLSADVRRIVLTDEPVSCRVRAAPFEVGRIASIVLETFGPTEWRSGPTLWTQGDPPDQTSVHKLKAGITAIRCRIEAPLGKPRFSEALAVDVRNAPPVLILLSMGGAWTGAPAQPPGNPDAQADLDPHGIEVDEDACRLRGIPADLIRELTKNKNVQCNDLCDRNCTNFIEYLGEQLLKAGLADELKSIKDSGYCNERENAESMHNQVIVGKWENSELEPVRPPGIRTWEQILDNYRSLGKHHVILVGQSHGGAKFAGMTRDHWRWDNDLTVDLFVSWDSADLGGGVSSVGPVPKTVLAFYQTANLVWWQNGKHIDEATEEHDLTHLFSHNAIARSQFVHDKTMTFISDTVSSIRRRVRGGDSATFRMNADGSLGVLVELLQLPPFSTARAFELNGSPHMCLVGKLDGHLQIRSINEHGMLGSTVADRVVSAGFTAVTSYDAGGSTYLVLASNLSDQTVVLTVRPDGSLGPVKYPTTPVQQTTGPLKGPWDLVEAFTVGADRFICLAKANGDLRIVKIAADGSPSTVVPHPVGIFAGFNSLAAIAFYSIGAATYLFTLGDGKSVYRMNGDGTVGQRVSHEPAGFGLALRTMVAHVAASANQSILLLDAVGKLERRAIGNNGALGPVFSVHTDQAGATGFSAYAVADGAHLFMLRGPT